MARNTTPIYEGLLLDDSVTYTVTEFMQICGIDQPVVIELVEYGVIEPRGNKPEHWLFSANAVQRSQRALRLQQDLAINWPGVSLALDLLDEVEELRQMLKVLGK